MQNLLGVFLFTILLCTGHLGFGQTVQRQLPAISCQGFLKIDGVLDEAAWKNSAPITHLVESQPLAGKEEAEITKTVVYLLYDRTSIYIGGTCYESTKDSISKELVGRDKLGVNDFIAIAFDTYNDKINGVGFFVTPYGEQYDCKYSSTAGEDGTWDAVWDSEAKVHNNGWSFEIRIPYSTLRFSTKYVQDWGLQIRRRRSKASQELVWNPVNPEVNGFLNQAGLWTGIQITKAPIRLSFSPYVTSYINHKSAVLDHKVSTSLKGGMDVKYGISQSFTLDMTLVPDFGQVKSDNKVLNLSPFEVRYVENRGFFTEGTELFNKGGLFYSRRIGQQPIYYNAIQDPLREEDHVQDNEVIVDNPKEPTLLNATKVSGRMQSGLGIGVFNATTKPMYAVVENDRGKRRKILTNPLTNYNITVLDRTLKDNSSVSFINTNVSRKGREYDANVSSALFDLNNKKNTFNFFGNFSLSNLYSHGYTLTGYAHVIRLAKTSGRFLVNISQDLQDQVYNKNDLSITTNNNYINHNLGFSYNCWNPSWWYNQLSINSNVAYSRRYLQNDYQHFKAYMFVSAQLKNLWGVGSYISYDPEGHDYYESRNGSLFISTASIGLHGWLETNRAKQYSGNAYYWIYIEKLFKARRYEFGLAHQYRFSDRLSLSQGINYYPYFNEAGYYGNEAAPGSRTMPVIIFSKRNRTTVENTLQAKYNFNKRSGLSLQVRHYWSEVIHKAFYDLQDDGHLAPTSLQDIEIRNQNQNFFNVDMAYSLQFAPGSFINLVWKEESSVSSNRTAEGYFLNFKQTAAAPKNTNLSIKLLCYLDYLALKKRRF